jgi:sugar phosphate isomerase/epimerase
MSKIPLNLTQLVGTLGINSKDLESLKRQCAEMKELGYCGVYFNNIFFNVENVDFKCAEEDILFHEDKCLIVRRTEDELLKIKKILQENDLPIPSSHFLNMLPEPGKPLESIFETHRKILDMAHLMGIGRLTTHIGGIAVPQACYAKKRPTPAELLEQKEVSYHEYAELVRKSYGKNKIIPDSIKAYRNLCAEAAKRGITLTIETACSELYKVNTKPELIIDFIREVGAANLGICIDSGHCHLNSLDLPEIIRNCGSYFLETHFHDNFGVKDEHNPVGIGTINWAAVINAMVESSYAGVITFEQGNYRANAQNWRLFLEVAERNS